MYCSFLCVGSVRILEGKKCVSITKWVPGEVLKIMQDWCGRYFFFQIVRQKEKSGFIDMPIISHLLASSRFVFATVQMDSFWFVCTYVSVMMSFKTKMRFTGENCSCIKNTSWYSMLDILRHHESNIEAAFKIWHVSPASIHFQCLGLSTLQPPDS